jgi:hypothetical protein
VLVCGFVTGAVNPTEVSCDDKRRGHPYGQGDNARAAQSN